MSDFFDSLTRTILLRDFDAKWSDLQAFIDSLDKEQFTDSKDSAGWTVKDHLIHLTVWINAGIARIKGIPRWEDLGVSKEVWESGEDPINAVLYEKHRTVPLDAVLMRLREVREAMLEAIDGLSDEEIMLPLAHYQPHTNSQRPLLHYIYVDTAEHIEEHMPWMKAIVAGK